MKTYTFRWVYEGFEFLDNEEDITANSKEQAEHILIVQIRRFFPNYADKVRNLHLYAIG